MDAGTGAILIGKTWRQGDFTVYNLEVQNQHNYFVRAPASDAAGLLVHNTYGAARELVYKHVDASGNTTYYGITNDFVRRAGEHMRNPEKSGTMVQMTGMLTHDQAREIEATLIRRMLQAAKARGDIDGTMSIREQLEAIGLTNKNRGRNIDKRGSSTNPEDHIILDGETADINNRE